MVGDLVWVCQYFAKRRIGGSHRSGRQGAAWRHDEGRGSTGRPDIPGAPADHLSQYRAARWGGDHPQGRIAAAGCILPLAQMDRQNFGTRHRAALGATEVSDATVIVVSEERGEVSVASKGHLAVMPDAEQLKETLNNVIEH